MQNFRSDASRKKNDMVPAINMEKQLQRMVAFIEMDGADKARDIDERAEEEYNLIKGNLLYNGRRELQELYTKRNKTAEKNVTQLESIIITKAKMVVQTARQNFISEVTTDIHKRLEERVSEDGYTKILKSLVMQALCMLREEDVIVQVREHDRESIQSAIKELKENYNKITGRDCNINLSKKHLPDRLIGGTVVYNKRCTLKIDNTLYDRLRIVLEQSMPMFREILFNEVPRRIDTTSKKHQIKKTNTKVRK
ncbi:hypothetical protein LSTR_LSTR013908 [Laodelphax striatellus]|uniref:V-type proton ATPase subunit E n=1 Tax=Laodelphax striatellus TaxID=195883 RepID=A0A482X4C0_LAOST|nr:hypothetical protein LSTR_LSTR013908 [Laodelphax striatellus]